MIVITRPTNDSDTPTYVTASNATVSSGGKELPVLADISYKMLTPLKSTCILVYHYNLQMYILMYIHLISLLNLPQDKQS